MQKSTVGWEELQQWSSVCGAQVSGSNNRECARTLATCRARGGGSRQLHELREKRDMHGLCG